MSSAIAAALVALLSTVGVSIAFGLSRTRSAEWLAAAYKNAEGHRIEAQAFAADVLCDQGLNVSRGGEAVTGLFRLVRALEVAPPERRDLRLAIGRALAAATMHFPEAAKYLDTDAATCAAFSPDGRFLVTGHDDGKARVWETATANLREEIQLFDKGEWRNLSFSPDGDAFVGTDFHVVRTWALSTHRPLGPPITGGKDDVWSGSSEFPMSLIPRFSSDGTLILIEGNRNFRAWVAATGKPYGPPIENQPNSLHDVSGGVFRPDGNAVIVLRNDGHQARLVQHPHRATSQRSARLPRWVWAGDVQPR